MQLRSSGTSNLSPSKWALVAAHVGLMLPPNSLTSRISAVICTDRVVQSFRWSSWNGNNFLPFRSILICKDPVRVFKQSSCRLAESFVSCWRGVLVFFSSSGFLFFSIIFLGVSQIEERRKYFRRYLYSSEIGVSYGAWKYESLLRYVFLIFVLSHSILFIRFRLQSFLVVFYSSAGDDSSVATTMTNGFGSPPKIDQHSPQQQQQQHREHQRDASNYFGLLVTKARSNSNNVNGATSLLAQMSEGSINVAAVSQLSQCRVVDDINVQKPASASDSVTTVRSYSVFVDCQSADVSLFGLELLRCT